MIVGVLQARMTSSRLPGKVLEPILGMPMIRRQLERLRRSRTLDTLVVATSAHESDDVLEKACRIDGTEVFRGSLDDVLDRVYQAALAHRPRVVVRLTADCPLADPALVDRSVEVLEAGGYDYVSNTLRPTYPDGLDVEAASWEAFERAWREACLPSEREHVMPFLYNHPELFKIGQFQNDSDLSALRWTVDEPDDLELVTRIYEALYSSDPAFTTADILSVLERHPGWKTLNTRHTRNEGYARSLAKARASQPA
jgi:spore coat polysaccharide biosynthesis protein SpsF